MKSKFETREVLADAYQGGRRSLSSMLRHIVERRYGKDIRVLCGRVSLESVDCRGACDLDAEPTCQRCIAKFRKFQAANS